MIVAFKYSPSTIKFITKDCNDHSRHRDHVANEVKQDGRRLTVLVSLSSLLYHSSLLPSDSLLLRVWIEWAGSPMTPLLLRDPILQQFLVPAWLPCVGDLASGVKDELGFPWRIGYLKYNNQGAGCCCCFCEMWKVIVNFDLVLLPSFRSWLLYLLLEPQMPCQAHLMSDCLGAHTKDLVTSKLNYLDGFDIAI